jgi:hypothetical protein
MLNPDQSESFLENVMSDSRDTSLVIGMITYAEVKCQVIWLLCALEQYIYAKENDFQLTHSTEPSIYNFQKSFS